MLLAKAVEQFYQRQLQIVGQKCPDCGGAMKRVEVEEYGRCWLCEQEERNADDN